MLLSTLKIELRQSCIIDAGTSSGVRIGIRASKIHLSVDEVIVRRRAHSCKTSGCLLDRPHHTLENLKIWRMVVVVKGDGP